MTSVAINPSQAEEYELPTLGRDRSDSETEEETDLKGLKNDNGKYSETDEVRDGEDDALLTAAQGDIGADVGRAEIVGKGTKIEQLIADVSRPPISPSCPADRFTWSCALRLQTVPSTDDPTLPSLTIRVLVLGSIFCVIGASASQIFYFKSNAPQFSSYFVILATYPLGRLLADERVIKRHWHIGGLSLNPGKFSIKEAILVRWV